MPEAWRVGILEQNKVAILAIVEECSLFVDYRVQLESLPSVYGQLSHTPKSLKRLYLRKLRISEEKVRGYEYKLHGATNVHFEADKGLVE